MSRILPAPPQPLVLAAALALAACGSSPAHVDSSGPRLDPPRQERLKAAEKLYRDRDPGFAAARDALGADPASAYWLTRLLVREVVWYTDHRDVDDATFLDEASGRKQTQLERAHAELRALGPAAVPCLVEDLLKSRFNDRRVLGAQILGELGSAVLPQIAPWLRDPDPRQRRLAVEALSQMQPDPEVTAELRHMAADPDFTVRATAYEGLVRCGPTELALVRKALLEDPDPFVRRAIVPQLARFHERPTALAVVEYLRRSSESGDGRGVEAARKTLAAMSGLRANLGVAAYLTWAQSLPESVAR